LTGLKSPANHYVCSPVKLIFDWAFLLKKLKFKKMKTKDINWYEEKVESIRKRKRNLHKVEDPKMRKKIKADLKREQRGAKRSEKNSLKIWIKNEIEN